LCGVWLLATTLTRTGDPFGRVDEYTLRLSFQSPVENQPKPAINGKVDSEPVRFKVAAAAVPDRKKDGLESAQTDEKSIQGTWLVVGQVTAGTFPKDGILPPMQWIFKENKVIIQHKDRVQNADFKLDPTQPLNSLDLNMKPAPGGDAKEDLRRGIYWLRGDS